MNVLKIHPMGHRNRNIHAKNYMTIATENIEGMIFKGERPGTCHIRQGGSKFQLAEKILAIIPGNGGKLALSRGSGQETGR